MVAVNSSNWMSGVIASTSLHQMSIPGSHESCALYGAASKCQNFSILRQLVRGIRFLDVRCKYVSDNDPTLFFPIHHGPDYQGTNFLTVQKECIEFLTSHPDETILMNVQQAVSDEDSATFSAKFNELHDAAYWSLPTAFPALGDHRKRIVLIRTCRRNFTTPARDVINGWDWPGYGLEWNGFAVSGISWNYFFETQNYWHGEGGSADGEGGMGDGPGGVGGVNGTFKGQKVEEYLDLAVGPRIPTKMFLNFLSRADTAIGDAASDINKRICSYIKTKVPVPGPRRLGVLPFDFVGNTGEGQGCLEDAIVEQNAFKADTSYTYSSAVRAPQRFKIQVSVAGQAKGWLVEGDAGWAVLGGPGGPGVVSADTVLVFERSTSSGVDYFTVQNDGRCLSIRSSEGQVGLYNAKENAFQKESKWLFSEENGAPTRLRQDGTLCCGNEGDLLEVAFVPA